MWKFRFGSLYIQNSCLDFEHCNSYDNKSDMSFSVSDFTTGCCCWVLCQDCWCWVVEFCIQLDPIPMLFWGCILFIIEFIGILLELLFIVSKESNADKSGFEACPWLGCCKLIKNVILCQNRQTRFLRCTVLPTNRNPFIIQISCLLKVANTELSSVKKRKISP